MNKDKIVVGSRASELALTQTHWVINQLKEKFPHISFEVKEIRTIGDKILDKTLNKIGGKGLFVKEIETALLQGEIDMAVHSMKDVPTEMTPDLMIGAITEREDVRDIFLSNDGKNLEDLPKGAKVGTSSLRRAAQILAYRKDIEIVPIRGNIHTRIRKIEELNLGGVILAAAGVLRMGWEDKVTQFLSPEICLPAVGQGALGIQIRTGDEQVASIVKTLHHETVAICVNAERDFMATLKGGCHVPIGAYGYMEGDQLVLSTIVAAPDGEKQVKLQKTWSAEEYNIAGVQMAEESLKKGAEEILRQVEAGE